MRSGWRHSPKRSYPPCDLRQRHGANAAGHGNRQPLSHHPRRHRLGTRSGRYEIVVHRERCGTRRQSYRTETETTDKDYRGVTGRNTGQAVSRISKLHPRAVGWKGHYCLPAPRSWRGGTVTERESGMHLHKPGIRVIETGALGRYDIASSTYIPKTWSAMWMLEEGDPSRS